MKNAGIFREYQHLVKNFKKGIPRYFKYQIITKLLLATLLLPVFWSATGLLIRSTGKRAVSNSQLMGFIFSSQGIVFLLLGALLLLSGILLEICGFITISAQLIHDEEESSYKELLRHQIRLFPKILEWGSLVLFLYLAVLIPLTNSGVTLSFLKGIRIPNFITSVIEGNLKYTIAYVSILAIMVVLSFFLTFTLHFVTIAGQKSSQALVSSFKLMKRQWKQFIKDFFLITLFTTVILGAITLVWVAGITFIAGKMTLEAKSEKVLLMAFLLLQEMGLSVFALLFIPFEIHHLTMLFYKLTAMTPGFQQISKMHPSLLAKNKMSLIDRCLSHKKVVSVLLVVSIVIAAVPSGIFFKEIFRFKRPIEVVGHRGGGGFSIPENSLSSISKSIKNLADYVEIDVQRAQDGTYIVAHDDTFQRTAGDSRSAQDMTLKEIKTLDIGRGYPQYAGEKVPTLEEVLDLCKGKIGIYIELKGKTADTQMVEDVLKVVRARNMERDIVLMALDYKLIQYTEKTYPSIDTGFVYFLNLGDAGSFQGDYIILEENAAKVKSLENIHNKEKKAAVWTVNSEASMKKFVNSEVDAIITDDIEELIDILIDRDEKSDKKLMMEMFFGGKK